MTFANARSDRQAKANAPGLTCAGGVHTIEAFKKMLQHFRRQVLAFVVYTKMDRFIFLPEGDCDVGFGQGVFAGVIEKDLQEFLELCTIAGDHAARLDRFVDAQTVVQCDGFEAQDSAGDEVGKIDVRSWQ